MPLEGGFFHLFFLVSPFSRRTLGMHGKQAPFGNEQIGQAKQGEELRGVLGQTTVAYLLQAQDILQGLFVQAYL